MTSFWKNVKNCKRTDITVWHKVSLNKVIIIQISLNKLFNKKKEDNNIKEEEEKNKIHNIKNEKDNKTEIMKDNIISGLINVINL